MSMTTPSRPDVQVINTDALKSDGAGCHAGRDQLEGAARAAGKSGVLDQYAQDYPKGPHDQPQSMCPAFGSLRVGLRMRRTATVLSGSACCVYGLTFTSHFYGGASSASTYRVSACPRTPRRRTCWPGRCCAMHAPKRSRARFTRATAGPTARRLH
jgi:hypothetical protein